MSRPSAAVGAAAWALALCLIAGGSEAALPPEAYEQFRNIAPIVFVGMVASDPGGQAAVRVEQVTRGQLFPGQTLVVLYPEQRGPTAPGAEVYYPRFTPGMRLRIFGHPAQPGYVNIVDGGIDVVSAPPPPRRGGCAGCAVGSRDGAAPWLTAAVLFGLMGWRRRARARVRGLIVAAAAVAACSAPASGPTAPAPVGSDGPEVATEGSASITVLSRPDHPSVKPPPNAASKPLTDGDCRMQQACAQSGSCSASGTSCIAAAYTDCEQMHACAHGRCVFENAACRAVATCKESHGCALEGLCADKDEGCTADEDGCKQSSECTSEGRCTVSEGLCIADGDDCKATEICKTGARCSAHAGSCQALKDSECKASPACKDGGACLARDGACVKSCAESELCTKHGRCGERKSHPGSCVALSDDDCDKSQICKDLGHCSLGLNARCEAADDVECRLSQTCKEDGRCTHERGRCIPGSDAECAQATIACKREGRCKHATGACVKG